METQFETCVTAFIDLDFKVRRETLMGFKMISLFEGYFLMIISLKICSSMHFFKICAKYLCCPLRKISKSSIFFMIVYFWYGIFFFQRPRPSPIALEPCVGNRAAVLSLIVRMPTGGKPYTPNGYTGIAIASSLVTLGKVFI